MSRGRGKAWLALAVKLMVAIVVFGVLLRRVDAAALARTIAALKPIPLGAAILLQIPIVLASGLRWQMFLHRLRHHHGIIDLTRIVLIGQFFGLFVPSGVGGDVVRVYYLTRTKVPVHDAVTSVILDRLIGVVSLGLLAIPGSLALLHRAIELDGLHLGTTVILAALLVVATVGGIGLLRKTGSRWLAALGERIRDDECLRIENLSAGASI